MHIPAKRFTLDGRLVGTLGKYSRSRTMTSSSSGLAASLRCKGTRRQTNPDQDDDEGRLTFPADHVPDHYLGLKLSEDGRISEVFNGPGRLIAEYLGRRRPPKTNLHSVSVVALRRLQEAVKTRSVARRR